MAREVKRAEVVSLGLVVMFDDEQEALLEHHEVFAIAQQVDAFSRARRLRGEDDDVVTSPHQSTE